MIGFIRGKLVAKTPPQLLIDVQGVGYELEAPMSVFYNLPEINKELQLYTHLVIRDDAHILFAFATEADRKMFRHLIKVNGVGPKLALTILSGQTAEVFYQCIQGSDVQALIRLPGVGKKTAERLIIEMRDKLPKLDISSHPNPIPFSEQQTIIANNPKQEAISALISLGYKAQDASRMIHAVADTKKTCEQMIKLALQGAASK